MLNWTWIFSIDINECENPDVCDEHQICNNTIGNYTVSSI